jgi:exonuclease III
VQYINSYLCLVPDVGIVDVFTLLPVCFSSRVSMDNTPHWLLNWVVLDWNVRGLNDKDKRLAVYNKIEESNCAVICLQETKCETFDHSFIRSFCPKRFDRFVFSPSIGAYGGLIVLWNSSIFTGTVLEIHRSTIRMHFSSTSNNQSWQLVNVYGPCKGLERDIFVQWLHDLDISLHENWLLLGDFNFIRSVDNRNKPGADMNDIFLFNSIISHLGLIELPLKGRAFTWSNMQDSPLLQKIDWFFTSCQWSLSFPNTKVLPLAKSTSDHVPCVVKIATVIPKAKIFRFENHWIQQPGFLELVEKVWNTPVKPLSASSVITTKFKNLRYELKRWGFFLSHLKDLIGKCNYVILLLDQLEDERDLSRPEFNFRNIVKAHLKKLLQFQYDYWKSRCTVRWFKLGGENTKFFHSKAIPNQRCTSP